MKKYVYLIFATETGHYKIGISKNPARRVKQLQTGSSEKLELISKFYTKYYSEVERMMHDFFHELRLEGEWFYLALQEVGIFHKKCFEFEKFCIVKYEQEIEL